MLLPAGFNSVILSTVEQRYHFSSTAAGFIPSAFEITVTLCVVFVSYRGGRGHKPRWIGTGCLIMGLGCLVFASPQFIFGRYNPGVRSDQYEVCDLQRNSTSEETCFSGNTVAYLILLLGQVIIGIGVSPLFTIGISFLDELVHPKYVSIHLACFMLIVAIGPAVGYGIGGALLSVYIDPWVHTHLSQANTQWLGAWWIPFVLSAISSFFISIPFFMYPRKLPNAEEVTRARELEMAKEGLRIPPSNAPLKQVLRDLYRQIKGLLTNITFLLIGGATFTAFLALVGQVAFAPKYVQSQFYHPASQSSLYVGATSIPSAGV